jgi:hypothetical protein
VKSSSRWSKRSAASLETQRDVCFKQRPSGTSTADIRREADVGAEKEKEKEKEGEEEEEEEDREASSKRRRISMLCSGAEIEVQKRRHFAADRSERQVG